MIVWPPCAFVICFYVQVRCLRINPPKIFTDLNAFRLSRLPLAINTKLGHNITAFTFSCFQLQFSAMNRLFQRLEDAQLKRRQRALVFFVNAHESLEMVCVVPLLRNRRCRRAFLEWHFSSRWNCVFNHRSFRKITRVISIVILCLVCSAATSCFRTGRKYIAITDLSTYRLTRIMFYSFCYLPHCNLRW